MKNIIIGSGPAGRLAGIELGKLGKEAILIEKKYIAGNCLNEGCMVICALNDIARFLNSKKRFENLGLMKGKIEIDYAEIVTKIKETQEFIRQIHQKENESLNNTIIYGEAIVEEDMVKVNGESFEYDKLLIATGSKPIIPNIKGNKYGLTSKDILKIDKIPENLNILGGGAIGIEIANIFSSFGSNVNIISRNSILKGIDENLVKFTRENLLKYVNIYENQNTVEIKKDKLITETDEFIGTTLIATGRSPNSEIVKDIVDLDDKKAIKVNKLMQSSKQNIYAAGDVTGGVNLTTIARKEGITAARNMAGFTSAMEYNKIPQGITLDMDLSYITKNNIKSNFNDKNITTNPNKNTNKNDQSKEILNEITIPGSGGPGSFWRALTRDTGLSKIKYNENTKEIEELYSISPSSISDISYLSYLIDNVNLEDFSEEFLDIHPSTNVFQEIFALLRL
ncbi:MAG: NAD(P)/FAD-dependent oxidoreductase [Methanobrevibacter sp.]|jgi:dihydrolipoamide dehydrogenase|nr:NAD(P)/FAD-dependent oxidoreductase [Candidatus Methanoflexus mossambicus]